MDFSENSSAVGENSQFVANRLSGVFPVDSYASPQLLQQEIRTGSNHDTGPDAREMELMLSALIGKSAGRVSSASISTTQLLQNLHMVAKIATDQKAEIDSHDTRVEEYMHRVNSSYEEVTFVRWLVSQIQFRGLQDDDETLAAQIWPELKSILGAEGVYYIKCHQTVQQTPSELCVPRIALAEGPLRLANELLADPTSAEKLLVWEYPQVHNSDQRPHGDGESAEVWSYIIVPVVNEAIQLGWILAVNKTVDSYFERSAHVDEFQPSEVEFGTYEATFMEAVATLLVTHAHNYSLFRAQEKLLLNTIRTLVNAVDARDPYTRGHSERVALTSRRLAEQLGLSTKECEEIYVAGLLHDIGKIGVPDRVLSKPGHLTDEEFELIKQHPTIGCQILRGLGEFAYVLPGVRYHHEAWDGSGYPDGLAGDAIPFIARIIAVADSYDAMTSNRPYRNGMPIEKAEKILRENVGVQWDEKVVEAYFQIREDIHAIVDSSTSE